MQQLKLTLIVGAIGAAACGLLWLFWSMDVARLEKAHKIELEAQRQSLVAACEKDKQITKEVSDELQSKLDSARGQLAAAKRVQQNRCVPTTPHTAKRDDAAPGDEKLHRPDGLYADDLLDFAYDAEVVGQQLDACQSFVTKVWARK